ncbi:MAG: hypothetical protein V1766_11435 [Pseudomonadota bacterium]
MTMDNFELHPHAHEITDWDQQVYRQLVSVELTPQQIEHLRNPKQTYDREDAVLAIHWHPEMVPVPLVKERLDKMFPNAVEKLFIPTQHNILMVCNGLAGVEVDCQATDFNRKIQLLFHFLEDRLEEAPILKSMLAHTYQYRQSQFYDYLETVINPRFEDRLQEAVRVTGMEESIVRLIRTYAEKLKNLLDANYAQTPDMSIKNKLLTNYFSRLREFYDAHIIEKAIILLLEVKKIVKCHFPPDYFYDVREVIEEARAYGAGIVIPHPEQFWPVLLADYDIDGIEVWNPQSREFTEFLIQVVIRKNRERRHAERSLLVMMGDDCHLSAKLLGADAQKQDSAGREVGYQPAWHEISIRKSLKMGNFDRKCIMEEYRSRLR